jgi:hypothetical protein
MQVFSGLERKKVNKSAYLFTNPPLVSANTYVYS